MNEQPDPATENPATTTPPTSRNRYAVPLSTLVGGAYVGVAQHVHEHPASPHADRTGGTGLGATAAGGDGDSD